MEDQEEAQSQSAHSPPAPLSFAAVVGGGSGIYQSSVGGGIQPAGGFDPLMSLREQSTAFSALSSDEVKFREGEVLLTQEQQSLR